MQGLVGEVVEEAMQEAEARQNPTFPVGQLSPNVRTWFEQSTGGGAVSQALPPSASPGPDSRPQTPTIRSEAEGESATVVSPIARNRRRRYGGIPVGADSVGELTELQEATGMIWTPAVARFGGQFTPEHVPQMEEEEVVEPVEKAPVPLEVQVEVMETAVVPEEESSAKESAFGSPPPAKRQRRRKSSERDLASHRGVTSETVAETPRRSTHAPSQGKDMRNMAVAIADTKGLSPSELQTPGVSTRYATSVYAQTQRDKREEEREARAERRSMAPLKYGGKGRGKGGRKATPKKRADGSATVTLVASRNRDTWRDPEVERAKRGDPPPSASTFQDLTSVTEESDQAVPTSGRKKRARVIHTDQQVPANPAVAAALQSGQQANKAKKQVTRRNPGIRALMEIREIQKETKLLIPKLPFLRLVKEVTKDVSHRDDYRWQAEAIMALQESSEFYIIGRMLDANLCAIHAKRVTIMPKDFHLTAKIREGSY